MQELGCFELVYVKSLMKSQHHETRSSMKLTVSCMYNQRTRNEQHYTNIHVQRYILDTLKNLKQHCIMLQNISMIVCMKKATKCVVIFPSQNDFNWGDLDVDACQK